jgi:hypothetical protein
MEVPHICGAVEPHDGRQTALMLAHCLSSPLCCLSPALLERARQSSFSLPPKAPAPAEETAPPPAPPQPTISPGTLVVLAIDPVATLAPLLTVNAPLEKQVRSMEAGMQRYLAFVRHVESPPKVKDSIKENNGKHRRASSVAGNNRAGPSKKETTRKTHLQLGLLHHTPPKRSRYDTIDESMCMPLEWDGQYRRGHHASPQSSPWRSSFGEDRAPLRIDGPAEMVIPASCRQLYAYTTIDLTAAVSSLDEGAVRAPNTSLSISEREMRRFDAYQAVDCLREEEECDDTSESGEAEEDCDLSTVISGLSMTGMGEVPLSGYYNDWDHPLISPTTVASRDTRNDLNSSEPSNSTQPTTLPSYSSSREEEESDRKRHATRLEPWFIGRQCTLQIRVWHDIEGALRNSKPADPRGLLEDLRQLQGYVPVVGLLPIVDQITHPHSAQSRACCRYTCHISGQRICCCTCCGMDAKPCSRATGSFSMASSSIVP